MIEFLEALVVHFLMANIMFMGNLSLIKYKSSDFQDVMSFEPYYIKDFHLIKKKDKWVRS